MHIALIFGSLSDAPVMKKAAAVLQAFDIAFSSYIISAHRTPELLRETISALESDGTELIIAAAGLAAHLPGVIASLTILPVIGVPMSAGGLGGLDALLSMVQMPKPIPAAVVGIDNAENAAYLACEILSIKYPVLKTKLKEFRKQKKEDAAKSFILATDWFK
ncbi:5-(carboxyamino)imidazole ribonucleotide mutase [Breznakiellaceae bacterium SP9]